MHPFHQQAKYRIRAAYRRAVGLRARRKWLHATITAYGDDDVRRMDDDDAAVAITAQRKFTTFLERQKMQMVIQQAAVQAGLPDRLGAAPTTSVDSAADEATQALLAADRDRSHEA